MAFSPPSGGESWHWIAGIIAIILLWEVVKYVFKVLFGTGKTKSTLEPQEQVDRDDYPDLQIPAHQHLEVAMDPPSGLHHSNPPTPLPFANDFCSGKYLFFHPPTAAGLDTGYGAYFKGKKRLWELRLQFKFKRLPEPGAQLYFGIELDSYVPVSASTRQIIAVATAAVRSAVGGSVYQSSGDDPETMSGEAEKPVFTLPLWAFDQFMVTRAGEEPPALTDLQGFALTGSKRTGRVSEYMKEIDALNSGFNHESTYTFAFWGNSQFLDAINWRLLKIPIFSPIDFDSFCGKPPVHAVLYSLDEEGPDARDGRHLQSRKHYYFKAAIWSSIKRPEKARFDALTGAASRFESTDMSMSPPKKSLKRRVQGFFNASLNCCTTRPHTTDAGKPGRVS